MVEGNKLGMVDATEVSKKAAVRERPNLCAWPS
jgi:hypothetical protein